MFDLVGPCKDCPFRNDKPHQKGWLGSKRAQGIYDELKQGLVFPCHKTTTGEQTDLDEHYDDNGNPIEDPNKGRLYLDNQFCAGALILLEKTKDADRSRAVITGERLGLYNRSKLRINESPVFDTEEEFVNWHGNGRGR